MGKYYKGKTVMEKIDGGLKKVFERVAEEYPSIAEEIREEIEADILDRAGLGDEFGQLDGMVLGEIRSAWEEAIVKVLKKRLPR